MPQIFKKLHDKLKPGGVLYISYPHATSYKHTAYFDITYLSYSPKVMDKLLQNNFEVEDHFHSTKKTFVGKYDRAPHRNPDSQFDKSYVNSSIVIARKAKFNK